LKNEPTISWPTGSTTVTTKKSTQKPKVAHRQRPSRLTRGV
jgi:hypothetical protein